MSHTTLYQITAMVIELENSVGEVEYTQQPFAQRYKDIIDVLRACEMLEEDTPARNVGRGTPESDNNNTSSSTDTDMVEAQILSLSNEDQHNIAMLCTMEFVEKRDVLRVYMDSKNNFALAERVVMRYVRERYAAAAAAADATEAA